MRIGCAGQFIGVGGGSPTARDYVQYGLIHMWDGIENDSWGVHNSNLGFRWNDLITDDILAPRDSDIVDCQGHYEWRDDCLVRDPIVSSNYAVWCLNKSWIESIMGIKHFEIGFKSYNDMSNNYTGVFSNGSPSIGNIVFIRNKNKIQILQGSSLAYTGFDMTRRATYSAAIENISSPTLYQNGVSSSYVSFSDIWGTKGGFCVSGVQTYNDSFIGELLFIRLYNRVLSSSEVAHNYAIDKARFNLP